MNKKIVLEIKEPLLDGELLIYRDGKVQSVGLFEMLPEYKLIIKDLKELQEKVEMLDKLVKELRGEDE